MWYIQTNFYDTIVQRQRNDHECYVKLLSTGTGFWDIWYISNVVFLLYCISYRLRSVSRTFHWSSSSLVRAWLSNYIYSPMCQIQIVDFTHSLRDNSVSAVTPHRPWVGTSGSPYFNISTMMLHDHYGVSNHLQMDSFFNSLFMLLTAKHESSALLTFWNLATGEFLPQWV